MADIKNFEQWLNEVYMGEAPSPEKIGSIKSADMKTIYAFLHEIINKSPIGFKMSIDGDEVNLVNPYKLYMFVKPDKEGLVACIYKNGSNEPTAFKLVEPDAKSMIKKLSKSHEFKSFTKGIAPEKMLKATIKRILNKPFDDENLITYIKYKNQVTRDKEDNSGPHATSGTSIDTYKINMREAIDKWNIEDIAAKVKSIKGDLEKAMGWISYNVVSISIKKYEMEGDDLVITVSTTIYYN